MTALAHKRQTDSSGSRRCCGCYNCRGWTSSRDVMVIVMRSGKGEGEGVVLRNGLQLQCMLLLLVRRQNLVKDDESAISIARREHQALPVR